MKPHFFVSDSTGHLHDTRQIDWSANPIRANYARHIRDISSVADVKANLRAGCYAWPGGYALAFLASDGAAICFDCVRSEFRSVVWSIQNNVSDGWKLVNVFSTSECEETECCAHCNAEIV